MMDEDLGSCDVLFYLKNEENIDRITVHGRGTYFAVNNST